ncbi:MAG: hypothetical protein JRJ20_12260 [Deltaproteobacteria bacterium]|jgi:hypothetical protein|nr:hypothetical protein [Deltaproteobacteria bacterium]
MSYWKNSTPCYHFFIFDALSSDVAIGLQRRRKLEELELNDITDDLDQRGLIA